MSKRNELEVLAQRAGEVVKQVVHVVEKVGPVVIPAALLLVALTFSNAVPDTHAAKTPVVPPVPTEPVAPKADEKAPQSQPAASGEPLTQPEKEEDDLTKAVMAFLENIDNGKSGMSMEAPDGQNLAKREYGGGLTGRGVVAIGYGERDANGMFDWETRNLAVIDPVAIGGIEADPTNAAGFLAQNFPGLPGAVVEVGTNHEGGFGDGTQRLVLAAKGADGVTRFFELGVTLGQGGERLEFNGQADQPNGFGAERFAEFQGGEGTMKNPDTGRDETTAPFGNTEDYFYVVTMQAPGDGSEGNLGGKPQAAFVVIFNKDKNTMNAIKVNDSTASTALMVQSPQ